MARIIIAEDSEPIRSVVSEYLRLEEHEVLEFESGDGVVDAVRRREPELCILDLMLPGPSGFEIAKQVREFSKVPILFLTARDDEASRITGFEIGADDYVVKPFSPRELVLRVKAILRRAVDHGIDDDNGGEVIRADLGESRLIVQFARRRALLDDNELTLTNTEWRILELFLRHPDQVVSRDMLMADVLEYADVTNSRTVDSHIKNLRAKMDRAPWIETVRGVGYRFTGEVTKT